jgi:hypothetical protein
MLPRRDDDSFGVGSSFSQIRDAPFVTETVLRSTSQRFEAYYSVALTPAAVRSHPM